MSTEAFEIIVDAKNDVLDIEKGKLMRKLKGHQVAPGKTYAVTVFSEVKYGDNQTLPVNKVVIYNTSNNNADGWFYVIEQGVTKEITIGGSGTHHDKVYAFLVDITSGDNSGTARVVFEEV